jgi:hypothetical protein
MGGETGARLITAVGEAFATLMYRLFVLVPLLASALPVYAAAMFVPLPNPPGMGSFAFGVSADGSVVVGFNVGIACCGEAFRWTAEGGIGRPR